MRYEINENTDNVAARLTAYALGELEDIDRAEVEVMLKSNPAARAEVDAIRAVAGLVSRELQSEPAAVLSTAQREIIEARASGAEPPTVYRFPHRRMWSYVGLTALAASIALVFIVPLWLDPGGVTRDEGIAFSEQEGEATGVDAMDLGGQLAQEGAARDRFDRPGNEMGERQRQALSEADDFSRLGDEVAGGVPADPALRQLEERGVADEFTMQGRERSRPLARERPTAMPAQPAAPQGGGTTLSGGGFDDGLAQGQVGLEVEDREQVLGEDADVARLEETKFAAPTGSEDSTFSIDVDTASYTIIRRSIQNGHLPPPEAVRIEEMLNYFSYNDAPPGADDPHPFASHIEIAACPWNPQHRLARISLKGRAIDMTNRVGSNLVFLIDVSGSMNSPDKLPLVKESLKLLVNELTEDDRISIVTYAGNAGIALDPTAASPARKMQIVEVIDSLGAGGSTHGSAGIEAAYQLAKQNFIDGGLNRVIMATDGDLNVGISDTDALRRLIEEKRETGIYLSILGFGTGNVRDNKLEELSNHGNGNYSYIDSLDEGKRVLVSQIGGTLFTIAENVKIQVDFNPEVVGAYRLIGYENRRLAAEDFRDDAKDAGEIGAGHGVTALYEIVPPHLVADRVALRDQGRAGGANQPSPSGGGTGGGGGGAQPERQTDAIEEAAENRDDQIDPDQAPVDADAEDFDGNLLRLKLRYRDPETDEVREFASLAADPRESFESASPDFQFAAAIATFGLVLRQSEFGGDAGFSLAEELALPGADPEHDPTGYRGQFLELVRKAKEIAGE